MKTIVSELNNTLDGTNGSLDISGEKMSELEGMTIETIQNEWTQVA